MAAPLHTPTHGPELRILPTLVIFWGFVVVVVIVLGSHLALFRDYSWLCALVVPGIELGLTVCEAGTLLAVLFLQCVFSVPDFLGEGGRRDSPDQYSGAPGPTLCDSAIWTDSYLSCAAAWTLSRWGSPGFIYSVISSSHHNDLVWFLFAFS